LRIAGVIVRRLRRPGRDVLRRAVERLDVLRRAVVAVRPLRVLELDFLFVCVRLAMLVLSSV